MSLAFPGGRGRSSWRGRAPLVVLACALSACGGGSAPPGATSTSTSTSTSLSAVQQTLESVYLQSNGGGHALRGRFVTPSVAGGGLQFGAGSYFYSFDVAWPQSPAAAPQVWQAAWRSAARTLSVPSGLSPIRFLIAGQVVAEATPPLARVSYTGGLVREDLLSADGTQVVRSLVATGAAFVPLAGAIAQSPQELFSGSDLGLITDTVNGVSLYDRSAAWQPGAGYLKVTQVTAGDQVELADCLAPATSGTQLTPCRTGLASLASFFPVTGQLASGTITYQFGDGAVTSVAGVQAWVASRPEPGIATAAYRMFYLDGGSVYTGLLVRDGTPVQTYPLGSQTPQGDSIVLNGPALASVTAALAF